MLLFVSGIAFFVGGATMAGALIGFCIKTESKGFNAAMLAFAGGIMGAAASMELIAPAVLTEQGCSVLVVIISVAGGAVFIRLLEYGVLAIRRFFSGGFLPVIFPDHGSAVKRVLLFVLAFAIHNFPEGLAAGVSCGLDEKGKAFSVALGIAIQNLPEGMVLIRPMLTAGLSKQRTLILALATGWIEIVGAFLGWMFVSFPFPVLTYMLPFAGGTMLYIIHAEVIPEALERIDSRSFSRDYFIGFCGMLLLNCLIGG